MRRYSGAARFADWRRPCRDESDARWSGSEGAAKTAGLDVWTGTGFCQSLLNPGFESRRNPGAANFFQCRWGLLDG